MLTIINDILDLSRIESGKLVLDEVAVDIGKLAAEVMAMLVEGAQAKRLQLVNDIQLIPCRLTGDATRIKQAMLNYLSNAIKFSDKGCITLRSRVVEDWRDHVLVRFEVQDQGIGIHAEALTRLFTPFEQVDNSVTRQYGGTGLGLAITRRLAEMMGGHAGAESVLGQGSTFWFTVRLNKAEVPADVASPTLPAGLSESAVKAAFNGQRILVVEDDALSREVVRLLLEGAGLAYDLADNGIQAVDLAARQHYALILMDVQMPQMGGIEATRIIRASDAQVPIIALTANALADDRERCLAVGMNDFLTKPFEFDKLFDVLLKWQKKGVRAEGGQNP